MTTIPTPEDARQAALARRQAAQQQHDAQLLEQRSVLYGDVQLRIEELMGTADVDDVAMLQAVINVLDGNATTPATESLSDDEQELVEAFRAGRIVVTERGAYRDTEWGRRERAPRSPEPAAPVAATPEPEPAPAVEPEPSTEPAASVDPEPEPAAPVAATPEPSPTTATPVAPSEGLGSWFKNWGARLIEPNPPSN